MLDQFYGQLDEYYAQGDLSRVEGFLTCCAEEEDGSDILIAVCNELGCLYRSTSRYMQSLAAFEKARALAAGTVGTNRCEYATILNNMAGTYRLMGDYEAAIKLFLQAMEIYQRAGIRNGYAYAGILNNLSMAYREAGRLRQAIAYLEQTLAIMEGIPDRSQERAITYNNLTELYHAAGDREAAMRCLNRALQEFEKCAGTENVHYAAGLNSLAGFLFADGDYEQALALYRKSAHYTRRFFGENVEYGITCQNMRWVYEKLGRLAEAADALETAARTYTKLLGPDHERTRSVAEELRRLREARGA